MKIQEYIQENSGLLLKGILVFVFAVSLVLTIGNSIYRHVWLKQSRFSAPPFNERIEIDYSAKYDMLGEAFSAKEAFGDLYSIHRDLFAPKRILDNSGVPFQLRQTNADRMFFVYKGHIEKQANEFIAQINSAVRTRFVRVGDDLDGWRVVDIDANHVSLESTEDGFLDLVLHKKTYAKEPEAIICMHDGNVLRSVCLGDVVDQYKILDIQNGAVILQRVDQPNSDPILLKK